MIKLFYTVHDVKEITGYSKEKAYDIIRELNKQLEKEATEKGQTVVTFRGRVRKDYFEKALGIERG